MTVNERFKEIRKSVGLNQSDFGAKIGISRDAIANIEGNRIFPKDFHIISICREFGVNKEWLLTGEGEMLEPVTRDEQIAAFIGSVQNLDDSFKKRFISMLCQLDEQQWEVLEKMAELLANEKDQD